MVVSIASWERCSLPPWLCVVRNGDSPNFIKQRNKKRGKHKK
jgi:hypothetical protein